MISLRAVCWLTSSVPYSCSCCCFCCRWRSLWWTAFPAACCCSFATKYPGSYDASVPDAANFYRSNNYMDDIAWNAIWLAVRTGNPAYKQAAMDWYTKHYQQEDGKGVWNNYDWDSNSWGCVVLLSRWVLQLAKAGFFVYFFLNLPRPIFLVPEHIADGFLLVQNRKCQFELGCGGLVSSLTSRRWMG